MITPPQEFSDDLLIVNNDCVLLSIVGMHDMSP